ncbi:alpha/beta fold hydrolase [Chitinophaga sp. CF418]|uniref:alpha/beta fold hydrolase n=1 Tax=Chitinophaga sp. CF418 TaxID=1855287 RepID=UPI00091F135F|nr:alpha/beta hydrolase [Chitinophaga sp. CF418]SHN20091.1 Pimeloyl-ACP methyl ester carboxylesterase [Chitinophaga sp. CF418]
MEKQHTVEVTGAPVIPGFTNDRFELNGIGIHYLLGGNPAGKPVILWHGFMGSSQSWKKVMPLLADAGFHILVPDMRGYGDSDKPEGSEGYDARTIYGDFRALVNGIGFGKGQPLTLVAHDMGAAPALIWSADHPDEIAALLYMEMVVVVSDVLENHLSFTPEVMHSKLGPMWWWILPFAQEALEVLFVGKERDFANWFYDWITANKKAIGPEEINETLRTFSGKKGVNGAFGIYRGVLASMKQTNPLLSRKVTVPIVAVGGEYSLGKGVAEMVSLVAENVSMEIVSDAGHFLAEEQPEKIAELVVNTVKNFA